MSVGVSCNVDVLILFVVLCISIVLLVCSWFWIVSVKYIVRLLNSMFVFVLKVMLFGSLNMCLGDNIVILVMLLVSIVRLIILFLECIWLLFGVD